MKKVYYFFLCGILSMSSYAQDNNLHEYMQVKTSIQSLTPEQISPNQFKIEPIIKPNTKKLPAYSLSSAVRQHTAPRLMSADEQPRPLFLPKDTMVMVRQNTVRSYEQNGEIVNNEAYETYTYDQYGLPKESKSYQGDIYKGGTSFNYIVDANGYWISKEQISHNADGTEDMRYREERNINAQGQLLGIKKFRYDTASKQWIKTEENHYDYEHLDETDGRPALIYHETSYDVEEYAWYELAGNYIRKSYKSESYTEEVEFKDTCVISKTYENGLLYRKYISYYSEYAKDGECGHHITTYDEAGNIVDIDGQKYDIQMNIPVDGYTMTFYNYDTNINEWQPQSRSIVKNWNQDATKVGTTIYSLYQLYDATTQEWTFIGEVLQETLSGHVIKNTTRLPGSTYAKVQYRQYDDNWKYRGQRFEQAGGTGYVLFNKDAYSSSYQYFSENDELEHHYVIRYSPLSEHFDIHYTKIYEKRGDLYQHIPNMNFELSLPGTKITYQFRSTDMGFPSSEKTVYAVDSVNQGRPFVVNEILYGKDMNELTREERNYEWPQSEGELLPSRIQQIHLKSKLDGSMEYSRFDYGANGEMLDGTKCLVTPGFIATYERYEDGQRLSTETGAFNSFYVDEDGMKFQLSRNLAQTGTSAENYAFYKQSSDIIADIAYAVTEEYRWDKNLAIWKPFVKYTADVDERVITLRPVITPEFNEGRAIDNFELDNSMRQSFVYTCGDKYRHVRFTDYIGNEKGEWVPFPLRNVVYGIDFEDSGDMWTCNTLHDQGEKYQLFFDKDKHLQTVKEVSLRYYWYDNYNLPTHPDQINYSTTQYRYAFGNYLAGKTIESYKEETERGLIFDKEKTEYEYLYAPIKVEATSIETINKDKEITVNGKAIHSDDPTVLNVYDMSGRLVVSGQHSVTIPTKGVFVIRSGNFHQKVIVK